MPRSGSTMLTAILNQHPDLYASEVSPIRNFLAILEQDVFQMESFKANYRQESHINVLKEVGNIFYNDINKEFILDKNRTWGTPYTFGLAKLINPNPKIIFVMRPILEVLASLISVMEKNPLNLFDNDISSKDFFSKYYREKNDYRCDYLMRSGGEIDAAILAVANMVKNHPSNTHLIWYENLMSSPQEELNKISDFLEISRFDYDFNNIKQVDRLNDMDAFKMILHEVRPSLSVSKTNPSKVLSKYVIEKYSNALDFLNLYN
jgi:sulfotransferase